MNARHFPAKGEKGVRFLFFRLAMGKRRLFSLHPCRQTVLPCCNRIMRLPWTRGISGLHRLFLLLL